MVDLYIVLNLSANFFLRKRKGSISTSVTVFFAFMKIFLAISRTSYYIGGKKRERKEIVCKVMRDEKKEEEEEEHETRSCLKLVVYLVNGLSNDHK